MPSFCADRKGAHGRAHLPRAGVGIVILAMCRMISSEAFWNEILDGLAVKLSLRVAEEFRCARIRATDDPIGIRDKNRVWRHLKQVLKRELRELGPVLPGGRRCSFFGGIRRAHVAVIPSLGTYRVARGIAIQILWDISLVPNLPWAQHIDAEGTRFPLVGQWYISGKVRAGNLERACYRCHFESLLD